MERFRSGAEHSEVKVRDLDFVIGVLGRISQRLGGICINPLDTKLHEAFSEAYNRLEELSDYHDLNLRFRCMPDLHGYSDTINDGINTLHGVMRWRNSYGDGQYITIPAISEEEYRAERSGLPGADELYEELAVVFADSYLS